MRQKAFAGAGLVAVIATVLTLLLPGVAAAAPSGASLTNLVGLNSHLTWRGDAEAQLGRTAAGGVHHVRETFVWGDIQPTPTTWSWTNTDRLLTAAARTGTDVLAVLSYSPDWATTIPGNPYAPPQNTADYARFVAGVVSRYGATGSFWAAHPELARSLGAIELWNEPWGFWAWGPTPDASAYAALAEPAALAARTADPTMAILVPGDLLEVRTDGQLVPWVATVLQARPALAGLVSAWSVHAYPYPKSQGPLVDHADRRWDYSRVTLIRDAVRAAGSFAPLWITELGWHTAANDEGVSEAQQAAFIRDAIVRAASEWSDFVARIYIYAWGWDGADKGDSEQNYTLLHADGTPKPAWTALTALLAAPPVEAQPASPAPAPTSAPSAP